MLVKYTYVDAVTGVPVTQAPALNGIKEPPGVLFHFALVSEYPTETPTLFGEAIEGAILPTWIETIPQFMYDAYKAREAAAKRAKEVPHSVTQRQARIVLSRRGMLDLVPGIIENLDEPQRTEAAISWEFATEFLRDDPFVALLGAGLGLSDDTLDKLFSEASKL